MLCILKDHFAIWNGARRQDEQLGAAAGVCRGEEGGSDEQGGSRDGERWTSAEDVRRKENEVQG